MDGGKRMTVRRCRIESVKTNKAYCSKTDARFFSLPGSSEEGMVRVNDKLVLTVEPDLAIPDGELALNVNHRSHIGVSENHSVSVTRFLLEEGSELAVLTVEMKVKKVKQERFDAGDLSKELKKLFAGQVMMEEQKVTFVYKDTIFTFSVKTLLGGKPPKESKLGLLTTTTHLMFETQSDSGIEIANQKGHGNIYPLKDISFTKLGIGGLDIEFDSIYRRAFASRRYPSSLIKKLGIQHVKGMLLWGPPGTGKTLIARQIGKMLKSREPKIVNGPEVLDKYVGKTEQNIRDLFEDAKEDQKSHGDKSELHIVIFDEIDAICKARGSGGDTSGVHDSIVNQLLTMIDGVDALNNILLIGMTNRKDLLDEALLRPGRLEVQIEIGLPNESGRVQILEIHTRKMRESKTLDSDVNLENLAERTRNYSGAELEGLVRSAVSFAFNRQIDSNDLEKLPDEDNIMITKNDFRKALKEIKPAFGADFATLMRCRVYPMMDCGLENDLVQNRVTTLVNQVKTSKRVPLLSCLLEGPSGSGKTALAATVALHSKVPFIKIVSAENMVGLSEVTKCKMINKVFEDAYKCPIGIIILDDIEGLLEFVNMGFHFSNLILQTLRVLIKKIPPEGRKLLIIGTTSMKDVMVSLNVLSTFNVSIHVPMLKSEDIKKVLDELDVFAPGDVDKAVDILGNEMPIKRLLMLVEMVKQGGSIEGATAVDVGEVKIDFDRFVEFYKDLS